MASMASQENAQQFQQAGVELAQILASKSGINPRTILESGTQKLSEEEGVCDGMVLRSGFCKPSRGGKRKRKMKGGACTRKLSKTLAALLILMEITGTGAAIYAVAPVEAAGLVTACYAWVKATVSGFLASLSAGINLRSEKIITLLWSLGVAYYGNTKMVGGILSPLASQLGSQFTRLCEMIERWLEGSPEAQQAVAAAGVDPTATGGARRRKTYKKRGGARRGGAKGSCGMSGGRKRKTRRKRKSRRGRKSRGHKSHRRKSRVHRKRRGHKSKKH